MPAPLAKGIIVASGVIIAAGIALYESPEFQRWIQENRRKIAMAWNGNGQAENEEIPKHPNGGSTGEEERRRLQEQLIRRRRSAIIRQARDEGVAVDLDELASVGREEQWRTNRTVKRADSGKSFDDIVGTDGMLKSERRAREEAENAATTARENAEDHSGLKARGRAEVGLKRGARFANPFADEMDLHDDALVGTSQHETQEALGSPSTLAADTPSTLPAQSPIHDSEVVYMHSQEASVHSTEDSYHYFVSPPRSRAESMSSDMLTPTSDSFATGASIVGTHADDIAVMSPSMHSIRHDDDAMSEAFSEIGSGQDTPSSWSDVGSEADSEWDLEHRQ